MVDTQSPFPTLPDDGSSLEAARVLDRVKAGLFGAASEKERLRIGRFVVLRRLGAGAMGEVFLGYDAELDRNVAIKLVRAHDEPQSGRRDERLRREAQAIAKLAHPNVVPVFEVGRDAERIYVVMEVVDGVTLRAWLREGPRRRAEILDVFMQAGRGLSAAHAAGVVHRDFKPDNVLVGRDGRARVVDFGLALATGDATSGPTEGEARVTVDGAWLGTPRYMAPECFRRGSVDARADQFSFCVALWEALYGVPPFAAESLEALAVKVLDGAIDPPPSRKIPRSIDRILRRGLASDRESRFPTMEALLDALARTRTRPVQWGAASAALGMGLVALAIATRDAPAAATSCPDPAPRLAGVWDDETATRLSASHGDAAPPVATLLHRYAERWREQHVAACKAHERGDVSADVLDRRMACLERDRGRLRLATERILAGDAQEAGSALEVAMRLPPPEACATRLLADANDAPDDAETAACVAEVRAAVDAANVASDAGDREAARAEAERAVARAETCGHEPAIAEANEALGHALWKAHDEQSMPTLQRAVAAAVRSEHPEVLARAAAWLSHRIGVHDAAPAQGLAWIDVAEAAAERVPGREDLRAFVLAYRAELLGWAGRPAEGLELHRRALKMRREVHGEDHPAVAESMSGLYTVEAELGHWETALELAEGARAIRERWYPPGHPAIARLHADAARALMELKRQKEAEARYREAIEMLERAHGDAHADLVQPRRDLAVLVVGLGRTSEALLLLDAAERAAETVEGPPRRVFLAAIANARGIVLAMSGDLERAEASFRRAVEHHEARFGKVHQNVAAALGSLCRLHFMKKASRDAIESCGRAIDLWETLEGADHPLLAELLLHRGSAQAVLGEREAARADLERAIALAKAQGADDLHDAARGALVALAEGRPEDQEPK